MTWCKCKCTNLVRLHSMATRARRTCTNTTTAKLRSTLCFPNSCGLPEPGGPSKHCSVFAVDIAGFGKRDNDVQRAVRHTLFASLRDAFGHAHVPWNGCYCRDSGDGILAAVPAQFPTLWLADPLIRNLSAALHRHNRLHHETARIQLRTAFASSPTTTAYPASPSSICSVCCNQPPSNML
jgi:hypothetical protein